MTQFGPQVTEALESFVGLGPEFRSNALLTVLLVFVLWGARRLLLRVVFGRVEEARARYQWSKGSGYAVFLLGLALLGLIWFEAVRGMGTFLGLLSAGLAIALRDIVANMAAWVFIILRHPFTVGDRIQVGEHRGDVVDIRVFQFTLLEVGNWVQADQSTGRLIHVPNARVFSDPLANYTSEFPFVWHEVPVLVTFESDWRRAKEIVHRVTQTHAGSAVRDASAEIRRASRRLLIHYGTLTPTVYTSVQDSGVLLTARFLAHVRRRRGLEQAIWEDVLEEFAGEAAVDLAYPTQRFYTNLLEGKAGARAGLPEGWGGPPVEPPTEEPE